MTALADSTFADPNNIIRPIITFINGDVSWLVSFPRPGSEKRTSRKFYYHALVDPWFGQPAIFISSWILEMGLGRESTLRNRAAVDATIVQIELAMGNVLLPTASDPAVDAIFIMNIGEHCHQESLLQFSSSTPVFAISAAASSIKTWKYFDTVVILPTCDPSKASWKEAHPGKPLPSWLTVFSPVVARSNNFGLVLITSAHVLEGELILLAPHGIGADESAVRALLATELKMLALMAPLKDSYAFGVKTVLGIEDGLAVARLGEAKYYVRSGDFVSLRYKGFIGWIVSDVPRDFQWGVEQLSKGLDNGEKVDDPTLVEVENGGSYVLV